MKTKIITSLCIMTVGFGAYYLIRSILPPTPSTNSTPSPSASVPQPNQDETDYTSVLTPQEKALLATGYVLTEEEREKLLRRKRQKDLLPTMEELKVMFDTPVEFYGQVLDQFNQPVIGAKIRCSWPYMGPQHSAREFKSAAPDGRFEIFDLKAASIGVSVYPPPGYDELVTDSKDIQIAKIPDRILQNEDYEKLTPQQKEMTVRVHGAAETYKGDKTKPVIFRLKKL